MAAITMQFTLVLTIFICILNSGYGNICPDKKASCPNSMTCCMMYTKEYGCCPFAGGVCCSDERHCCPSGTTCDVKTSSCIGQNLEIPFPWMVQVYANEVTQEGVSEPDAKPDEETKIEKEVDILPDERQKCPDGNTCKKTATCCQMKKGNYGCCPFPVGNCCSDKEHCCPAHMNCDVKHGRCIPASRKNLFDILNEVVAPEQDLPIFNYVTNEFEIPTTEVEADNLQSDPCNNPLCPYFGGHCCKNPYGGPLDICCPIGTKCATEMSITCLQENEEVPSIDMSLVSNIFENELPASGEVYEPDVICPDKTQACPSYATCCPYAKGGYGCCLMPEATCCADKLHCCANGYVCTGSGCVRKPTLHIFDQIQIMEMTPLQVTPELDDIF